MPWRATDAGARPAPEHVGRPKNPARHQTYSAGGRGVEFLMCYYPILDRAPKGRDEGDGFQLWIRRHDEYDRA